MSLSGATRRFLELRSKIDAAQDNAGRSALQLPGEKFARGTRFDPIAQPHELSFALVGLASAQAFQAIQGGGADCTGYLLFALEHRKQDDHPFELVTAKATSCKCHNLLSGGGPDHARVSLRPGAYVTVDPRELFLGGLISAIFRRQSASESCGPETNVPLTFVLYQPDTTPSRSDSSVLTWRGESSCMVSALKVGARLTRAQELFGCCASNNSFNSLPRAGQNPQARQQLNHDDGCRPAPD